nr:hypothetical protein CFP56_64825 [Quercus suber]
MARSCLTLLDWAFGSQKTPDQDPTSSSWLLRALTYRDTHLLSLTAEDATSARRAIKKINHSIRRIIIEAVYQIIIMGRNGGESDRDGKR